MSTAAPETPAAESAADTAERLLAHLAGYPGALVAYSGGVDSGLLAFAAHRALGARMQAVLAVSPSLSQREHAQALAFARRHGLPLVEIHTPEMENPHYRRNDGERCFHCKQALFERLAALRAAAASGTRRGWAMLYGANQDDLGDHRPGMRAAAAAGAEAPFIALGMGKAAIRAVCRHFGLEIADKPASPCLASRIAYGIPVSAERLRQVEAAEQALQELGCRPLRVRHHGTVARIEVAPAEFATILRHREKIVRRLSEIGFAHVALDLAGFRSGSLNAALESRTPGGDST